MASLRQSRVRVGRREHLGGAEDERAARAGGPQDDGGPAALRRERDLVDERERRAGQGRGDRVERPVAGRRAGRDVAQQVLRRSPRGPRRAAGRRT